MQYAVTVVVEAVSALEALNPDKLGKGDVKSLREMQEQPMQPEVTPAGVFNKSPKG